MGEVVTMPTGKVNQVDLIEYLSSLGDKLTRMVVVAEVDEDVIVMHTTQETRDLVCDSRCLSLYADNMLLGIGDEEM